MPNYGLLTEMANGIKEGMLAYQTASQIKRQNQLTNLQQGLVENPQTGQLEYTPEMKQKMATQAQMQQLQLQKLQKELGPEGSLEDQYKKAQIEYLKGKTGTETAKAGLLGTKEKMAGMPKPEKEEKLPATAYTAAGFAQRLEDANKQIEDLGKTFDPTTLKAAFEGSQYMPEIAKSENIKLLNQAKRNFLNAVLRKESGAAISPSEFASGNAQYFPAPGDTEAVLQQKQRNREVAIASLKAEGEKALPKVQKGLVPQMTKPPALKPGAIEDGHRFKGGDPSNPKNWEAI